MDMEFKFGQMVRNILENGNIIKCMELENSFIRREMFMKDSGRRIKQMASGFLRKII